MGIQGLLPLLKSTMQPIHIKDLQGCCVAVDTYSWLHKGALSCSTDLCKGRPTSRHIEYCMHRVNLLRHYGVKPVLVFDGGFLPMKLEQENKRARSRKENLARAIEHEANGNSTAAYECYQKAVDISPSIAHDLIQVLKQENVSYVVAPYEADAQMTFLAVNKQVDAVITEDSDLIAFGCPRIIFKMDKYGQGVEFQYSRLHKNRELCLAGFTNRMVLEMCILSGCDYLQSLPGMGLKRAHALVSKFKSYEKVIKHLRYSTVTVPPLYEELFRKAILTFQHQRVYDPVAEDIVHLSDIPESQDDDADFLGPYPLNFLSYVAKGIAAGDLDPFTQMPFQGRIATAAAGLSGTSKVKTSKPESTAHKIDLPVQKNLLTNYFCFASIEAKRKFKAPRKSPTSTSALDMSSLKDYCDSGRISCSSPSDLNSEKLSTISPHAMVESQGEPKFFEPPSSVLEKESMGHMPLKAFGQSLNQSGQAILKECDSKNYQSTAQGVTQGAERRKVIVRSRYFQHKPINADSHGSIEERAHDSYNVLSDLSKGKGVLSLSAMAEKEANGAESRQESLLNVDVDSEEHRIERKKVIVRSRYFQHKPINKDNQDSSIERAHCNTNISCDLSKEDDDLSLSGMTEKKTEVAESRQESILKGDAYSDREQDGIALESAGFGENNTNESTLKRKTSQNGNTDKAKRRSTYFCNNASSSPPTPVELGGGCSSFETDEELTEKESGGGKFGANIEHLSQYSKIAEKSVDRFATMLSSFRYSSSGSRASGLRAPLRDIKNTCASRSTSVPDFTKFAYTPKNKGTAASSKRR
ncbi:unnamed protein product [Linum trigynum]|uniref:Exonuclease 1 n=1 Tax=Linum trigynum TaxID=586398 RepID=A0AAV2GK04_9ROSI